METASVPAEAEEAVVRGVLVTGHAGLDPAGGGDLLAAFVEGGLTRESGRPAPAREWHFLLPRWRVGLV